MVGLPPRAGAGEGSRAPSFRKKRSWSRALGKVLAGVGERGALGTWGGLSSAVGPHGTWGTPAFLARKKESTLYKGKNKIIIFQNLHFAGAWGSIAAAVSPASGQGRGSRCPRKAPVPHPRGPTHPGNPARCPWVPAGCCVPGTDGNIFFFEIPVSGGFFLLR